MKRSIQFISFALILVFLSSCGNKELKIYADTDAMVTDAKTMVEMASAAEFKKAIESERTIFIVDVREKIEYDSASIPEAIHIPRGLLEFQIGNKVDRRGEVYVFCSNGDRSALAACVLPKMKYSNVKVLDKGFDNWKEKYPELVELEPKGAGAEESAAPPPGSGGCGG